MLYKINDLKRIKINKNQNEFRTEFRRDFARLVHSPAFRRLQGKTQLYPGRESDFFRNRLTHSMEVAQIAKSIALKLNYKSKKYKIDTDLIEFAALAHDLGHPPFGHIGEAQLDTCMLQFGGYEGNAQTLRILTKLEKKEILKGVKELDIDQHGVDNRLGLNLTFRSLASILKYDNKIGYNEEQRQELNQKTNKPVKGYYSFDEALVKQIKQNIVMDENYPNFKTIECKIMDIADDIAYATYDLEDAFKAGFIRPMDIISPDFELINKVKDKINKGFDNKFDRDGIIDVIHEIFEETVSFELDVERETIQNHFDDYAKIYASLLYQQSCNLADNGYMRAAFTSGLVNDFINGINVKWNNDLPVLSNVWLSENIKKKVEILKTLTYEMQIESPILKVVEFRGKEIVKKIFTSLSEGDGYKLLPNDYKTIFEKVDENAKHRIICDFVAGMTDRYAIEFYGRLTSENPETIFKPL